MRIVPGGQMTLMAVFEAHLVRRVFDGSRNAMKLDRENTRRNHSSEQCGEVPFPPQKQAETMAVPVSANNCRELEQNQSWCALAS
jgi:hypothetical protein